MSMPSLEPDETPPAPEEVASAAFTSPPHSAESDRPSKEDAVAGGASTFRGLRSSQPRTPGR